MQSVEGSFLAVLNVFRSSVFVGAFCREVAASRRMISVTLREQKETSARRTMYQYTLQLYSLLPFFLFLYLLPLRSSFPTHDYEPSDYSISNACVEI